MASFDTTVRVLLAGLSIVGLLLSLYSVHVEHRFEASPMTYQPLCNVDEHISCTDVFSSEYSRMAKMVLDLPSGHPLDQPNAVYGALHYVVLFVLVLSKAKRLALVAAVFAMAGSFWLFYVLIFILQVVCLICLGIHIVNSLLLLLTIAAVFGRATPKVKTN